MKKGYNRDSIIWKKQFGIILKRFFTQYNLDYRHFAEEYSWSTSTIRYWFEGRSCPKDGLTDIKEYFFNQIPNNSPCNQQLYGEIRTIFENQKVGDVYLHLRKYYPTMNTFAGAVLETCRSFAKNEFPFEDFSDSTVCPTGKTQAVVFDFDGTLTSGNCNRTTWESIWVSLGYDIKRCQELHMQFNRGELTHSEWCKLTEKCFCERHLHRSTIEQISSRIHLIKGVKKTFQHLHQQDIKIYIVSGSIMTVIRSVIRPVYQYVDGIKANEFRFSESGILKEIVGTKYDFEGKASYIREIAEELQISTKDILFIGNSINDQFAYVSGARTLCINPKLTDISNTTVWNDCIHTCRDLTEILNYL